MFAKMFGFGAGAFMLLVGVWSMLALAFMGGCFIAALVIFLS